MNKKGMILILVLILIGTIQVGAQVSSLTITFIIIDEDTVIQQIEYLLKESTTNLTLFYANRQPLNNLKITSQEQEISFDLKRTEKNQTIDIQTLEPINNLTLTVTREDILFHNSDASHFFVEIPFEKPAITRAKVRVILPQGHGLQENGFLPLSGNVITDGRNVIIEWKDIPTTRPSFFSVLYHKVTSTNTIVATGIIIILGTLLFLFYFYHKKKTKKVMLVGFRKDEQKAIDYLRQKKNIDQKELQLEFGFSKAKTTRILKRLERRELILKEKFGKANKITWRESKPPFSLRKEL